MLLVAIKQLGATILLFSSKILLFLCQSSAPYEVEKVGEIEAAVTDTERKAIAEEMGRLKNWRENQETICKKGKQ